MYSEYETEIVGVAPLVMHNGQLADPNNKFAKALKAITSKPKKTEADYMEMARIEFVGSLYMNDEGPILPSHMLESMIIAGAKKSKLGNQAKAGIIVERSAILVYDGPRTADGLLDDDSFRLAALVRVTTSKVMRTRPIFAAWAATIVVSYLPRVINKGQITEALRSAGGLCGVGDWRPRHGRFALREDMTSALAA